MRILIITSEGPDSRTGFGRLVKAEADGLRHRSHVVDIVFPTAPRRVELKFSRTTWRRFSGYDIIHVYGPSPMVSDFALWRNHDLPHVYSHVAEIVWLSKVLSSTYRRFHSFLARNARAIIVNTREYARLFDGRAQIFKPPISLLPRASHPRKNSAFTVLFAGQLRPFKGIDVLLRTARSLPSVRWVIAGSRGWAEGKYLSQARKLSNVVLKIVENDRELARLYDDSHVLLVPAINTTEAFSLTAIEGALFGCVPVASDLMGVRENVKNLGGITFPPNSSTSLASIIRSLSGDLELWRSRSEESRKRAIEYAKENTVEKFAASHETLFELVA